MSSPFPPVTPDPTHTPGATPATAPGPAPQAGTEATQQTAPEQPATIGEASLAQAPATAPNSHAAAPRAVYDVPLDVQIVLGHAEMTVDSVMKLGRGAVVEIERRVGDAVDVCINNHLVARGEVVLVDGEKLGVALTEVVGGVTH